MAIDTRSRRAACLRVGRPWMTGFPLADGTIGAADRKHMAFSYPGILAGAIVGEDPDQIWYAIHRATTWNAALRSTTWTATDT